MARRLQEYVKYSTKELDQYIQTEGSCIHKINTNLHLSMRPFCLADFKRFLKVHLIQRKVGFYDIHLHGIVLDIKKVKVLGTTGAIRSDDPGIHFNINADVYIFKPVEGAELTGLVKHIGLYQVGVILYRVFSANLRVAYNPEIQMDQEVRFRIRKCNLQNVYPYIDGELLTPGAEALVMSKNIFKQEDNSDSGIEERDGTQELDNLLSIIKSEPPSEFEELIEESKKEKSNKSKKAKACSQDLAVSGSPAESTIKKSSKKRKSISSVITSSNTEDTETLIVHSPKKIKRELSISEDSLSIIKSKSHSEHEEVIKERKKEKHKKSKKARACSEDSAVSGSTAEPTNKKSSKKRKSISSVITSSNTEDTETLIVHSPKKIKQELSISEDSLSIIKSKSHSEDEEVIKERKKEKHKKSKKAKACSEDSAVSGSPAEPTNKKSSKKRKSISSVITSSNTEDTETLIVHSPKKIKQELSISEDSLSIIKFKSHSEHEEVIKERKKKKHKKSKKAKACSEDSAVSGSPAESTNKKSSKKRKSISSAITSSNTEDTETLIVHSPKKIKRELSISEDSLSIIKSKSHSEHEEVIKERKKEKHKKSKKAKACSEDSAVSGSPAESTIKKSSKKRNSISSFITSSNTEDTETLIVHSPKKIKREISFSDDSLPSTSIKIKNEMENSAT